MSRPAQNTSSAWACITITSTSGTHRHNRWNAVKVGPHKDIVALWKQAAHARGLKFGVSEHLWISYKWFGVAHGADETGPLQDVPYDGHDPAYFDLYHEAATAEWARGPFAWNDAGIPDSWKQHWFLRMRDLVSSLSTRSALQ